MSGSLEQLQRFFRELRRRKVYRVSVAYLMAGFVVIQVANLAAAAFDLPPWFEPLIWVLAGLGFPMAVILAWAFELTPEGVKRTSPEEPGGREGAARGGAAGRESAGGGRSLVPRVLLGLVLLAAAAFGSWYLLGRSGSGEPVSGERSIAVLPFDNLSGTPDAEPYARGIHDDLLARLSSISGRRCRPGASRTGRP